MLLEVWGNGCFVGVVGESNSSPESSLRGVGFIMSLYVCRAVCMFV